MTKTKPNHPSIFSHSIFVERNEAAHKARHETLELHLEELITDFVYHTHLQPDRTNIKALQDWAKRETVKPSKEEGK